MALYDSGYRSVWGPVGKVELYFEVDDGGTPADPIADDDPAYDDDVPKNVMWRNPNPENASVEILFQNSGQVQQFLLAPNTPDWQRVAIPQSFQARWGRLTIQGPNYPATAF